MTGNFGKIRAAAVRNVSCWPDSKKNKVYEELDGGKAVLTTKDQLDRYLLSFGNMHQAKLEVAISTISVVELNAVACNGVELIDYGCGQGIGSIVAIDYLNTVLSGNAAGKIVSVKLIEPSAIAIRQARAYLTGLHNLYVESINKDIDQLNSSDLNTNKKHVKLHIFSNILDVSEFDLRVLFEKITSTQSGENYFLCVSPDYYSGNIRLDEFANYFRGEKGFASISERHGTITRDGTSTAWHHYEKVFKTNR